MNQVVAVIEGLQIAPGSLCRVCMCAEVKPLEQQTVSVYAEGCVFWAFSTRGFVCLHSSAIAVALYWCPLAHCRTSRM